MAGEKKRTALVTSGIGRFGARNFATPCDSYSTCVAMPGFNMERQPERQRQRRDARRAGLLLTLLMSLSAAELATLVAPTVLARRILNTRAAEALPPAPKDDETTGRAWPALGKLDQTLMAAAGSANEKVRAGGGGAWKASGARSRRWAAATSTRTWCTGRWRACTQRRTWRCR